MDTTVDLSGQWAIVTGANTGIGQVTARELARMGARVTYACRSEHKAREAMTRVTEELPDAQLDFVPLDLGDLAGVRRAAEALLNDHQTPIDILVNNAGLAGHQGQTIDGFEVQFGVNHLGHFLWTMLLLERVRQAPAPRVVNVASRAHTRAGHISWEALTQPTKTVSGFPEYCVSKLCNVLFSRELARLNPDIDVYALHPGVVASDVWRRVPGPFRWLMKLFMITNEQGAATTLHCATSPEAAGQTGLYWDRSRPKETHPLGRDDELAQQLWRRSLEWSGLNATAP